MSTNIYYKSIFGSTKKYAHWLQNSVGAKLYKLGEINKQNANNADTIIIMSGTYAGQMPLINTLVKNWPIIKNKKVIVVAVGAAPPDDSQSQRSYELIPENIRKNIKYYKLPGKLLNSNKDCVKDINLEPIIKEVS